MPPLTSLAGLLGLSVAICACSNSAGRHDKDPGPEKVVVPTGPPGTAGTGGPGEAPPKVMNSDDTRFHLRPEEGTLTIAKAEGKIGARIISNVVVTPGNGLHLATDYPIKLTLAPTSGVALEKTEFTAGGRDKSIGDATSLAENRLSFAIAATADKPGTYEVTGTFKFGVCDKDSCHPKRQPISISIAAN